mgnify:CR=1 FL=1
MILSFGLRPKNHAGIRYDANSDLVRRSDDGALNQELLGSLFNDRTLQHVADHEANIANATVESVNAAVRKHIVPENLVIGVAGDFAKANASEASKD